MKLRSSQPRKKPTPGLSDDITMREVPLVKKKKGPIAAAVAGLRKS